jgi:hypothetical protein
LTKQEQDVGVSPAPQGDGAPDEFRLTRPQLVEAIEAELRNWFFDGVSPTLGQYAIDHIVGGILQRVLLGQTASEGM